MNEKEIELAKDIRKKINFYRRYATVCTLKDEQIIKMYYMFKGNLNNCHEDFEATNWYFGHLIGGSERILILEKGVKG